MHVAASSGPLRIAECFAANPLSAHPTTNPSVRVSAPGLPRDLCIFIPMVDHPSSQAFKSGSVRCSRTAGWAGGRSGNHHLSAVRQLVGPRELVSCRGVGCRGPARCRGCRAIHLAHQSSGPTLCCVHWQATSRSACGASGEAQRCECLLLCTQYAICWQVSVSNATRHRIPHCAVQLGISLDLQSCSLFFPSRSTESYLQTPSRRPYQLASARLGWWSSSPHTKPSCHILYSASFPSQAPVSRYLHGSNPLPASRAVTQCSISARPRLDPSCSSRLVATRDCLSHPVALFVTSPCISVFITSFLLGCLAYQPNASVHRSEPSSLLLFLLLCGHTAAGSSVLVCSRFCIEPIRSAVDHIRCGHITSNTRLRAAPHQVHARKTSPALTRRLVCSFTGHR